MYLITFSYSSNNSPNQRTDVYIHKDGVRLQDAYHTAYYGSDVSGWVGSLGGRTVYQRLKAGNTIHLQSGTVTGHVWGLILCVEFINN